MKLKDQLSLKLVTMSFHYIFTFRSTTHEAEKLLGFTKRKENNVIAVLSEGAMHLGLSLHRLAAITLEHHWHVDS